MELPEGVLSGQVSDIILTTGSIQVSTYQDPKVSASLDIQDKGTGILQLPWSDEAVLDAGEFDILAGAPGFLDIEADRITGVQ